MATVVESSLACLTRAASIITYVDVVGIHFSTHKGLCVQLSTIYEAPPTQPKEITVFGKKTIPFCFIWLCIYTQ